MLEKIIRSLLSQKEILIMTHTVIGYPDLNTSYQVIEAMVENGSDLIELQIPFSEPIADGPLIEEANQRALAQGITVANCFEFAQKVVSSFPIPFLFMSYYNILFCYGVKRFAEDLAQIGLAGALVPDLPIEEGKDYLMAMKQAGLDPILFFAPSTPLPRMKAIAQKASGFIYCVARKGVTGQNTAFDQALAAYLARARQATELPLALGFGIKNRADIAFLKGKAEIAVIGSELLRLTVNGGPKAVAQKLKELRS